MHRPPEYLGFDEWRGGMKRTEQISTGALCTTFMVMWIIVNVLVPNTLVTANRDAWLGEIPMNLGHQLLLLVTFTLAHRFPGKSLVQLVRGLLGRWVGTLLALLYALFYLYYGASVLRSFSDFIVDSTMGETPISVIMILMGLVAAYGVRLGLETLTRSSQVILPILLGWLLLTLVLVIPKIDLHRLLPILEGGTPALVRSFVRSPSLFAETSFLLTLGPLVKDRGRLQGRLHLTLLCQLALNMLLAVLLIAVAGVHNATTVNYPIFVLSRRIDVADFIQRIEALFMTVVVLGYFVRLSFHLYAASVTFSEILGLEEHRPLVLPLLPILISLSVLVAASQQDYKRLTLTMVLIPLTWLFGLIIPLALLLIDSLRRLLGPGRQQAEETG